MNRDPIFLVLEEHAKLLQYRLIRCRECVDKRLHVQRGIVVVLIKTTVDAIVLVVTAITGRPRERIFTNRLERANHRYPNQDAGMSGNLKVIASGG